MDRAPATSGGRVISTPDRRVRVFVSSTLAELAAERIAARDAIEAMRLTPVLFELGARPHPPRALYAAYIDQSDVFIGIYWQRYGWVAPDGAVSGVEDEYELSSRLPRLLYVKEPAPERDAELAALIKRFETEGSASYRTFAGPDELGQLIADDLAVLLSERFESARALAPPLSLRSTVPVPLTPTIGRKRDVAAVARLLRRRGVRLVTVTGTGGVGKTRLAVVVAQELANEFPGGVFFVPLASLVEPRHLIATIAENLGVRLDDEEPLDAVVAHLRDRRALLILDNFEHLVDAAPDLVSLLDRCARLQLLVTSRQVMRVRGEHEYALAPLDVPSPSGSDIKKASAVKLFVERGAAARHGFALTPDNEAPIAELCRRLDGLPLALELAAARLRLLEPDELLDRLGHRLDLLTSGAGDLPERQRALRATLDWSYNLLTLAEQALFCRLSVFVGGASLVAVEAVCRDEDTPDVLEVMASLLEKSLLVHTTPAAGPARFQLLHVVRAYAWEQLAARGETELLRRHHARWFLDAAGPHDDTTADEAWWEFLDVEIDNVRAVLGWLLEQSDLASIATMVRALRGWWWARGLVLEALAWLDGAAGIATRLEPASVETAWILRARGHLLWAAGRSGEAEEPLRTAVDLFTAHGEGQGAVGTRLALAQVLADQGRTSAGIALAREALQDARALRRSDLVHWAASILGVFLAAKGDLDSARDSLEEARDAATPTGSDAYLAITEHLLALVELMAGGTEACWKHLSVAASIYSRTPHVEGVSYALEVAAAACLVDEDTEQAVGAWTEAQRLRESLTIPVWPVLRSLHDDLTARLRRAAAGHEFRPQPGSPDDATALLQRLCERHFTNA